MKREHLLTELDLEAPFVRAHIAKCPDDKLDWKPHPKSMSLKKLAGFLGVVFTWFEAVFNQDEFDSAQPMDPGMQPKLTTTQDLLELFDRNLVISRKAIADAPDDAFDRIWTLKAGKDVVFAQPKWLVWRTYVMNHAVHHRAQLGVFLRLLGVAVPAVYNESADDQGGMFKRAASVTEEQHG